MKASSHYFYRDLKSFSDSRGVAKPEHFFEIPDDWCVVLKPTVLDGDPTKAFAT